MSRMIQFTGFVLIAVWTIGCDGGSNKVATATVKGSVTLDGKELAEGEIHFEVIGAGATPTILAIKNGEFSGEASVGKNKVSVYSYRPGPPSTTDLPDQVNFIPARYNFSSTLEANLTKEGPNDLKFAVTSK